MTVPHSPRRDDDACGSAPAILLIADQARHLRLLGGAFESVPPGARPGMQAHALFAPGSREAVEAAIRSVMDGRYDVARPREQVEISHNGVPVRLRVEPLRDIEGRIVAACLITERNPGALPLDERRLDDVARSQRREALGQLALGVAHDFGNLVSGILGAADALSRIPALVGDAEANADVAAIRAASQRAGALVRQLLAFGGSVERRPAPLALDAAIGDLATLLKRLWQGRAKLVVDLDAAGRSIEADPTEFDQIILNLALNARDAMLDGGTLTIRTRAVAPDGAPHAGRLLIELADTGIGIAPDVLPRIFDPFFTTKRSRGGTGLGLATVANLVRAAGATISVDSTVGIGTRVRMLFPEVRPAAALATTPSAQPAGLEEAPGLPVQPPRRLSGTRRVVLLVDDDDLVRRLAARVLTQQGWFVLSANSGEQALALLADAPTPPHALVTDLAMPGIGGEDLIEAVRRALGAPTLPAVITSGYRIGLARVRGADTSGGSGRTRVLDKPYLPSDLLEVLEELLADLRADANADAAT